MSWHETWRDEPMTDEQLRFVADEIYSVCWKVFRYSEAELENLRDRIKTKGRCADFIDALDRFYLSYDGELGSDDVAEQTKAFTRLQDLIDRI